MSSSFGKKLTSLEFEQSSVSGKSFHVYMN